MRYNLANERVEYPSNSGDTVLDYDLRVIVKTLSETIEMNYSDVASKITELSRMVNQFLGYPSHKEYFEKGYEFSVKENFKDIDTADQDFLFYRWFPDRLHLWNVMNDKGELDYQGRQELSENFDEGVWISNEDIFKIAKRFYSFNGKYKEGIPYDDITDEIFDTENEPLVDYKGNLV